MISTHTLFVQATTLDSALALSLHLSVTRSSWTYEWDPGICPASSATILGPPLFLSNWSPWFHDCSSQQIPLQIMSLFTFQMVSHRIYHGLLTPHQGLGSGPAYIPNLVPSCLPATSWPAATAGFLRFLKQAPAPEQLSWCYLPRNLR